MHSILEYLVSDNELNSVNLLMSDKDNTLLMLKSLSQRLLNKDDIFPVDPNGQILLIVASAPFVKSDEECVQVTRIIKWGMDQINIFPMITEHHNKDLAYRCLISLSFFHSAMEKRTKYHGSPSLEFYRNVGIKTFKDIGFQEISEDFQRWESYLNEMFV